MENVILSKGSSKENIKRYFKSVLEISKSGKEYPINLDEVWPLVYSEKGKAVRALKENFMQDVDYQVLAQNGKNPIQDVDYQVLRQNPQNPLGGRPSNIYMLTVPCMEFFIARKVRAVFEVYRQVFHGVATGVVQVPKTFADALRLAADQQELIEKQQLQIESVQRQNKQITVHNVKKTKSIWWCAEKSLSLQCLN